MMRSTSTSPRSRAGSHRDRCVRNPSSHLVAVASCKVRPNPPLRRTAMAVGTGKDSGVIAQGDVRACRLWACPTRTLGGCPARPTPASLVQRPWSSLPPRPAYGSATHLRSRRVLPRRRRGPSQLRPRPRRTGLETGPDMKPSVRAELLQRIELIEADLAWGANFVAVHIAVAHVSSAAMMGTRFTTAGALLLPIGRRPNPLRHGSSLRWRTTRRRRCSPPPDTKDTASPPMPASWQEPPSRPDRQDHDSRQGCRLDHHLPRPTRRHHSWRHHPQRNDRSNPDRRDPHRSRRRLDHNSTHLSKPTKPTDFVKGRNVVGLLASVSRTCVGLVAAPRLAAWRPWGRSRSTPSPRA